MCQLNTHTHTHTHHDTIATIATIIDAMCQEAMYIIYIRLSGHEASVLQWAHPTRALVCSVLALRHRVLCTETHWNLKLQRKTRQTHTAANQCSDDEAYPSLVSRCTANLSSEPPPVEGCQEVA